MVWTDKGFRNSFLPSTIYSKSSQWYIDYGLYDQRITVGYENAMKPWSLPETRLLCTV